MSPWQEVLIFFAVVIGLPVLFIAALQAADYLRQVRHYRTATRRIKTLTQDIIYPPRSIEEIDLHSAIKEHSVTLHSLKGHGLESATVDIEPVEEKLRLLTGLGLTFISAKAHQSMVVRKDTHITLDERQLFDVPVTCLDFHKAVPTPQDDFIAIEEASPLIRTILAVADNAQVDPFVTQLAVWRETNNVNPRLVAIGRLFDFNTPPRKATRLEAQLSEAVLKKAHELIGARKKLP